MAKELSETRNKTVTDKLIRDIQVAIIADKDIPNLTAKNAHDFWEKNKDLIIGLSVDELKKILRSARNKQSLMKQYEQVVSAMSWRERIEFMKKAEQELVKAKNRKFNTAVFVSRLMEISLKVLPIVLAAL